MLGGEETVEIAWGELRREGARQHAGRTGNRANSLRRASLGGEKKPLRMSELGCADGCGRRGRKGVGGNGWRKKAAADERAWLRGRLQTVADGV